MNISRLSSVLVVVTAILCSCSIDEGYDFDNYNPEMTFFVNGLNLKLGDIAPVTIDSLLALAQHTKFMNHLRTDEQGNYYFGYSDYLTLTHQSPGTQGQTLPDLEGSRTESFGKIPLAVKNVEWDVDPVINVTLSSNLNVPSSGELVFTPYPRKKEAVTVKDIALPISDSPARTVSETITVRDIPGLFRTLPDSLTVSFKLKAADQSPLTPGTSYSVQADYNIEVPLIFGNDVNIIPSPSMVPLPEEVHNIVANNPFGIEADVLSTLPMGARLEFSLIDSKGKEVELESECSIIIPTAKPGEVPEPVHFSTTMSVKDKGHIPAMLRIDYQLNVSGNMWINKNQYIRLSNITLVLPKGITIL